MNAPAVAPRAARRAFPVMAALAAVVVFAAGLLVWRVRPEPPPVLGGVPDFALLERSGRTITPGDLAGTPYVASFIFTRCTGMCPALSARMAELRRRAAEEGLPVRFVSFSVDPLHDRPEVLQAYAGKIGADVDDWYFLTGDRDALYALIGGGFKLSVAERSAAAVAADGGELITHSDRLVLVDGAGQIRGYYRGPEPDTIDRILRDLAALPDT